MKDTFGVQQKSEAEKNRVRGKPGTFSCTVLLWAWKWDNRLKSIIGIQSETTTEEKTSKSLPDNKTNNTKPEPYWKRDWFRITAFGLFGILGTWGTMTLWNNGYRDIDGTNFILGPVQPLTGFLALFAIILSFAFLNVAIPLSEEE